MNIHHRLQQLDKENIQQICSQMGIRYTRYQNKAQLITTLLLPLQKKYKMDRTRSNTGKGQTTTVVKSQSYYNQKEMENIAQKLHNLKKTYTPTKEKKEF